MRVFLPENSENSNFNNSRISKFKGGILKYCFFFFSYNRNVNNLKRDGIMTKKDRERLRYLAAHQLEVANSPKNLERVEKENARLEAENDRLRAIMETKSPASVATAAVAPSPVVVEVKEEEKSIDAAVAAEEPKKSKVKNRVGSMFDLLTFSDI